MSDKPVRVMIVDDSSYMRFVLGRILSEDPGIEVAGAARDGMDALQLMHELEPDVITLDIEMPRLDGYETLRRIMRTRPTPVIMVSNYSEQGDNATIRALELGAVDFVRKPDKRESLTMASVKDELIAKIKIAASVNPDANPAANGAPASAVLCSKPAPAVEMKKLVVIACSTGGPKALARILPSLPGDMPAGIIIVQHMPAGFTASLAGRLDLLSKVRVTEAKEGEQLCAGHAFVAPGNFHLRIRPGGRLHLSSAPNVNNVRPAADVTMKDAAEIYKGKVIGVVLTGMGLDGAAGGAAIRAAGGVTIAQHKSTCIVDGMPAALIDSGNADYIVPLSRIVREILDLV
jgi:two-component system chemotaxis response regulator CheB